MKSSVESALHSLGWDSFDLWINAQQARNLLPLSGTRQVIYDITDDWTKMPQPSHIRRAAIDDDQAMLAMADHVIVCSKQLYESKNGRTKSLA